MYNRDKDVEQCIKAETKTLYPEEYERTYGPVDGDTVDNFSLKLCLSLKNDLCSLLRHLNSRTSVCDLVDDKTSEEIFLIKDIQRLCEEIYKRIDRIYETP